MQFRYEKTVDGRVAFGLIEAGSKREARTLLTGRGEAFTGLRTAKKLPIDRFWQFTDSLSTLLGQGYSLTNSLDLIRYSPVRVDSDLAARVQYGLHSGRSLAETLERVFRDLPSEILEIVAVAEMGGNLAEVLRALNGRHRDEVAARQSIKEALAYPIFVLLTAIIVCWILFDYIVPGFNAFMPHDAPETLATQIVFSIAGHFGSGLEVIIWSLFFILGWLYVISRVAVLRTFFDRLLLKIPFIGNLAVVADKVRFVRVLSQALNVNIPAERGFEFAANAVSNHGLSQRLIGAYRRIRQGYPLEQALGETHMFDLHELFQIRLAEQSGALADGFDRMYRAYVTQRLNHLRLIAKLAGPVSILLLGIAVGSVAVGIVVPIFSIQQSIEVGL